MATYSFKCRDIGMECGFETSAGSMNDLMPLIAKHASEAHNMTEIPEDLKRKVSEAIKSH